jgi:hypothetical protein
VRAQDALGGSRLSPGCNLTADEDGVAETPTRTSSGAMTPSNTGRPDGSFVAGVAF